MNWIDTISGQPVGKSSRLALASQALNVIMSPKRAVVWLFHGLLDWHRDRAERAVLRGMDERMLKDIGITRGQADHMASIPWERRNIRKRHQA